MVTNVMIAETLEDVLELHLEVLRKLKEAVEVQEEGEAVVLIIGNLTTVTTLMIQMIDKRAWDTNSITKEHNLFLKEFRKKLMIKVQPMTTLSSANQQRDIGQSLNSHF